MKEKAFKVAIDMQALQIYDVKDRIKGNRDVIKSYERELSHGDIPDESFFRDEIEKRKSDIVAMEKLLQLQEAHLKAIKSLL